MSSLSFYPVIFYLLASLAVAGGVLLVAFRNPVSSALSMVVSFVGLAGLFVGLNAFFVGVVQVLVYAGAIMVLFIFIIMLLDLKSEETVRFRSSTLLAGLIIPVLLLFQVLGVIQAGKSPDGGKLEEITAATMKESAESLVDRGKITEDSAIYRSLTDENAPKLPDTNLVGHAIFTNFNLPLQIVGTLLLVATVGVVILSKRSHQVRRTDS